MFSQAFRRGQQQAQPQQQQLGIYQQLQAQQSRAFSQTQYEKENFSQLMASTKRQTVNESICQEPQQINEVYRILEQLQQLMMMKFNDFQTSLHEQEKLIKPLIEQNTQLNTQLTTVLSQSEKILQQLTINLEKTESQLKKQQSKKSNCKENEQSFVVVSSLLTKLDDRLNTLSNEVELIAESNNRFQVQVMEIVNIDKLDHRDNMQRVLKEMEKAKRSLSKKLKR